MSDPTPLFVFAGTALAGLGLASAAALRAWTQWLELRRERLAAGSPAPSEALATLRARVKRLEAIASGEI
jgi:hypothetical protein